MDIDTQPTVVDEHVNEGTQILKSKPLTQSQKDEYNQRKRAKRLTTSRIIAIATHKDLQSREWKALMLDQKNDYNKRRRAKRSMAMASKTRVATAVEEPIHFEDTNINCRRRIRRKQEEKVEGPLDIGIPSFECPFW